MTGEVYWGSDIPSGLVHITHPTRSGLLDDIAQHFDDRRGFTLATLNLDHCVKLARDPAFLEAYRAHSHVVADGNPIVWLSRRAGREVELIPGSELIDPLSALAARQDVPVALFGSTEGTLGTAATALAAYHRGLRVVARIAPPHGFDVASAAADALIADLGESGARLCFLALGAPKQERFAIRAAAALPSCGFVSIGAGLDFIAGTQTRAPRVVRRLKMEWLWRMALNPRRLTARYAACAAILPGLMQEASRQR